MLRLARRWNQTGQKFAGEPGIARTFFPAHNLIMWVVVVLTYGDLMYRLSRRGFRRVSPELSTLLSITLCLAAFAFKVAFTNAEAPELLKGFKIPFERQLESTPLVTQARAVFMGLGLSLAYNVVAEFRKNTVNNKPDDAGGAVPAFTLLQR